MGKSIGTSKAIFHQVFHWNRPKSAIGFSAQPSSEPQTRPRDFIAAAIEAKVATKVPPARIKAAGSGDDKGRVSGRATKEINP